MKHNYCEPNDIYKNFLSVRKNQYGGEITNPFIGQQYQSGYGLNQKFLVNHNQAGYGIGNILGGLFRSFVPLVKNVAKMAAPVLKSAAKTSGKELLKGGIKIAKKLADGENLSKALKSESQATLKNLINNLDQPSNSTKKNIKNKKKSIKRKRISTNKSNIATKKRKFKKDIFD